MEESVVRNLVLALGGRAAVTDRLGLGEKAVPAWYFRGIPKVRWPDVVELAVEQRVPLVTLEYLRSVDSPESHVTLGTRDLSHLRPKDRRIISALEFGQKPIHLAAALNLSLEELLKAMRRLAKRGELRSAPPVQGNIVSAVATKPPEFKALSA